MNFTFRTLIKLAGLLLGITGLAMVPALLCALYFHEGKTVMAFGISATLSVVLGFTIYKTMAASKKMLRIRDGYLIVVMCWIVCSIFGAIPFFLSGQVPSFIDCLFESVAGYTTTGASVVNEQLSQSLILWKATTHWLGGMGILVFIISILPTLGIDGQRIVAAETPGPALQQMAPRTQDFTRLLYIIYISFTLVEFLLLWIGSEMNSFEALVNSLGSISTAGTFLHPEGIAFYDSLFIEMVISIFSILASINFILYIQFISGSRKELFKNRELQVFLGIIALASLAIAVDLRLSGTFDSFATSLRQSFFQVTSFICTSGFSLSDYTVWPTFSHLILFVILFIGGCSTSTSGGIKVVRIIVMFKLVARGFLKRLHPRAVSAVKIGDNVVSAPAAANITTFIFLYLTTFIVSCLVLSLEGLSIETTMTAVASLMSTTGAGLGEVGPNGSFAVFSPPLRVYMSLLMVVGRLELFTVFLMLFPSFWNPNKFITK